MVKATRTTTRPIREVVDVVNKRKRVGRHGTEVEAAMAAALTLPSAPAAVWLQPHLGASGNHIASELKKLHDDSLSVFPESVYSAAAGSSTGSRVRQRWASTMRRDFVPLIEAGGGGRHYRVDPDDDAGVPGALGGGNSTMFQKWKVPSRLTESARSKESEAEVDDLADEVEELRLESPTKAPEKLPEITPRAASVKAKTTTFVHNPPPPSPPRGATAQHTPENQKHRRRRPKALATKMLLESYDQGRCSNEQSTAERWLQQASDADKKMVAKALKMQEYSKSQREDVARPVKQWLKEASAKEREVALTFFQSLAGTQLMGGSSDKRERVDRVLSLLKNPPNAYTMDTDHQLAAMGATTRARLLSGQRFRHLNLLTPTTRRNKASHQTWHHLPPYPDTNKVFNQSAILTEPHSTVHRHFTIHPDWGP